MEDPEKGGEKYQRGMSRCLRNVPSSLSSRKIDKSGTNRLVSRTEICVSEVAKSIV